MSSSASTVSRNNARSRGAADKRRGARKSDRDGDVLMGIASQARSRVGKAKNPSSDRPKDTKGKKDGLLSGNTRRAVLRQAAKNSDTSMKDHGPRTSNCLVEIEITGWEKSKASDSEDKGIGTLLRWIEKKASQRLGSKRTQVKIEKSRVEETDLIISVPEQDSLGILRLNGFVWASAKLHIKSNGEAPSSTPGQNPKTEETRAMIRHVLERRYSPETKVLDLSALGQDEELCAQSMFDKKSTASKCFPAMMVVLEKSFDTKEELNAAVEGISLANNELQNLSAVTTLAQTLPKLKNLDLSNNQFSGLKSLSNWRKRFPHLQHLIISNNPLEQNEPNYAAQLVDWYPQLRILNDVQVRGTTPPPAVIPQLPSGITIEMAEQMVTELSKQTGMTLQYSKDCMEQVGWDFPKALEAFDAVKANIPADAFIAPMV